MEKTGITKKDFRWIENTVDSCKPIRSETTSARTKLLMLATICYVLDNYNVTIPEDARSKKAKSKKRPKD